jgi:hypothetical protein
MPTAPVVTNVIEDRDSMTLGVFPLRIELKGKPEPRLKVAKLQNQNTGEFTVRITAPKEFPLSTLDAVARRIIPGSKVRTSGRGPATIREYAKA